MGVEASRPPAPRELNPGSVRIVTRDDSSATHIDIGNVSSVTDEEETTTDVSPRECLVFVLRVVYSIDNKH